MPSIRDAPFRARIYGVKPAVDHDKVRAIVSRQREIDRLRDEQDILIYELVSSGLGTFTLQKFVRLPHLGSRAARGAELLNETLHLYDPDDEQDAA
jgi:hypothetical protein